MGFADNPVPTEKRSPSRTACVKEEFLACASEDGLQPSATAAVKHRRRTMTDRRTRNAPPARRSSHDGAAFRLAAALMRKPLLWSRSRPAASELKTLPFVMFRALVRALRQYQSLVLLLKSGAWEVALILVRSPYELNVNRSEIATAQDPEERARTFVTFGKFQQLRAFARDDVGAPPPQPISAPLQAGIRFLRFIYPQPLQLPSRSACPSRTPIRAYHVPPERRLAGVSPAYTPVAVCP